MSSPDPSMSTTANSTTTQNTTTATSSTSTSASSGSGSTDTMTKINSVQDLMKKAPKVYNMMLQGIAITICNQMKASQDRIHEINQQSLNS